MLAPEIACDLHDTSELSVRSNYVSNGGNQAQIIFLTVGAKALAIHILQTKLAAGAKT